VERIPAGSTASHSDRAPSTASTGVLAPVGRLLGCGADYHFSAIRPKLTVRDRCEGRVSSSSYIPRTLSPSSPLRVWREVSTQELVHLSWNSSSSSSPSRSCSTLNSARAGT
jgi:hypothetical protein